MTSLSRLPLRMRLDATAPSGLQQIKEAEAGRAIRQDPRRLRLQFSRARESRGPCGRLQQKQETRAASDRGPPHLHLHFHLHGFLCLTSEVGAASRHGARDESRSTLVVAHWRCPQKSDCSLWGIWASGLQPHSSPCLWPHP